MIRKGLVMIALIVAACGQSALTDSQFQWCVTHPDEADRAAVKLGYDYQISQVFAFSLMADQQDSTRHLMDYVRKNPDYIRICQEAIQ